MKNVIDENVKNAVEEYQCSGCTRSGFTCYEKSLNLEQHQCESHSAGTFMMGVGKIFLGLSKGFNRLGINDKMKISMFKTLEEGWGYNKFNIPVWKTLNEQGHTVVRGMCPRVNDTWLHIYLEDCMDKIDCLEITKEDIEEMS